MSNVEQLLTELRKQGVKVWAEDGLVRVNAPKGTLTPALRSELATRKVELLAALGQTNGHSHPLHEPIRPVSRDQTLPLSFNQQRLWVMERLNSGSAYNQFGALCCEGELSIRALTQSLTEIVRRHESLRTVFPEQNGAPVQLIQLPQPIQLPVIDLTQLAEPARAEQARQLAVAEAQQPFDLAVGPILRVKLLRLAPQSHILFLTAHHICGDGWSGGILSRELATLYAAYVRGVPSPLSELPVQYADFAVWQRQAMGDATFATQLTYWKQHLAGLPPLLELPTDHPRPAVQAFRGDVQRFELSHGLAQKLKALGSRSQTTPFMTGLAAFAILLARYSRRNDIAIGTLIANRSRPELEALVGFFANTLVLRVDLSGEPMVLELLARIRRMTLAAYDHQDLPFEKLVDELRPERSLSYNPLFQVLFTWESNSMLAPVELPGLTVRSLAIHPGTAKFDLHLNMGEAVNGGYSGELEYNTDLFDAGTIIRMIGHLQVLLEGMTENPEQCITKLPILTESERYQLLVDWNDTAAHYPEDKCLHQLFEEQVERTPDAVAVTFEDQQLTYRELNERANQLAHHLQRCGAGGPMGAETLVGICVERSLEMIVGLLGILKAGGAYVPLDPTYPPERLAFMLRDAQVPVLLTQSHLLIQLPASTAHVVCLDSQWGLISQESIAAPINKTTPDQLAYVIYTSGSTGQPKGAMNVHRGLCNLLNDLQAKYQLTNADKTLQTTAFSFDVATAEMFWPLLNGASLVLTRPDGQRDSDYLVKTIQQYQITTLHLVPTLLQLLLEAPAIETCATLKRVIVAGEALPFSLQQRFFARINAELHNLYGPTETAIYVTAWQCRSSSPLTIVPIGRPLANTCAYVLDGQLQPTPIGVPGELYIGGVQVGRGYWQRPDLTQERFIANPFGTGQLYRTGDLARYLPARDSPPNIEFLGRIDHQVKIRGFRIELGEIEAVLAANPTVQEAVVVVREEHPADKRLIAYVVPEQEQTPTPAELRHFLQERLPEYMIPSAFVLLDALPLTPNGKVDRHNLPALDTVNLQPAKSLVAPRDTTELELSHLWEEMLQIRPIGVHDNFFDLGGHSLLAVRLMAQIQRQFKKQLPLATVFRCPTVGQMAIVLRQDGNPLSSSPLVPIQPNGAKRAFFCVPGVGGMAFVFYQLTHHLGTDRPIYALQPQGLDGRSTPLARTQDLAAFYIHAIRSVQPKGPYLLGGHSYGAWVAYEMAHQLLGQGQAVELLAVFDMPAFVGRDDSIAVGKEDDKWLDTILAMMQALSGARIETSPKMLGELEPDDQLNHLRNEFIRTNLLSPETPLNQVRGIVQVLKADLAATGHYRPKGGYPRPITLLRTDHIDKQVFGPMRDIQDDPTWGWQRLSTTPVNVHIVPGDHSTMLAKPHVQVLAEQFRGCLDRTEMELVDAE